MVMVVMPSPEDGGDGEIMVMVMVVQAIVAIDTCSEKMIPLIIMIFLLILNHPDYHYPYHPYQ